MGALPLVGGIGRAALMLGGEYRPAESRLLDATELLLGLRDMVVGVDDRELLPGPQRTLSSWPRDRPCGDRPLGDERDPCHLNERFMSATLPSLLGLMRGIIITDMTPILEVVCYYVLTNF